MTHSRNLPVISPDRIERTSATPNSLIGRGAMVFVSHGRNWKVVREVERLLIRLGFKPIVVEDLPDCGLSPGQKVSYYLNGCAFAVVVATADRRVGNHWETSQNVIHEIGLLQHALPSRVIYLKERTVKFPSNINPTYISFETGTLTEALLKLALDLTSLKEATLRSRNRKRLPIHLVS